MLGSFMISSYTWVCSTNFDDHTSIYYYYEFNKVVGKWVRDAVWWQCVWLAGRWYWRAGRWWVGVVEVGVHGRRGRWAGTARKIAAAWTGGFNWGHSSTNNKHHIIHMVVRLASIWVSVLSPDNHFPGKMIPWKIFPRKMFSWKLVALQ